MAAVLERAAPAARAGHRARDAVDLRDPLLRAMLRAERQAAERTLSETALRMRVVDASAR